MRLKPGEQSAVHIAVECVQRADVEAGDRMFRVDRHFLRDKAAPAVILDLHLVLGIHCILFALDVLLLEQR